MKATATLALLVACSAALAETQPLQTVPKNLARQHYAANLFYFDAANQRYVATEAAAAWLDDDVATGWPAQAGKQHYLLQLAEPGELTGFALSGRDADGTVRLFTGDEPAAPGDASWTLASGEVPVPFKQMNNRKFTSGLNRMAKYVLIETNIVDPGPIYSLYLYGDRSAATESIVKRAEPVDIRTVAGEFVNNQTSFNVTSIYGKSLVTHSNAGGGAGAWQRAIDDQPNTFIAVQPSTDQAALVAKFDRSQNVTRMSIQADPATKGKVDVFLLSEAPTGNQPVNLEGLTPSATMSLEGTTGRAAADVEETPAAAIALRWTPETAGSPLPIRELNTFADLSLSDYEVTALPPMVAEGPGGTEGEGKEVIGDGKELLPVGEGKETVDFKGGSSKNPLPPVAAGPGQGYRPGGLGFPPLTGRPLLPPRTDQPVSP